MMPPQICILVILICRRPTVPTVFPLTDNSLHPMALRCLANWGASTTVPHALWRKSRAISITITRLLKQLRLHRCHPQPVTEQKGRWSHCQDYRNYPRCLISICHILFCLNPSVTTRVRISQNDDPLLILNSYTISCFFENENYAIACYIPTFYSPSYFSCTLVANSYSGQNQSTDYSDCWPKCAHGHFWVVFTVILTTLNNTRQCFYQSKKCTRYTLAILSTFWLILTLAVTEGLMASGKIQHWIYINKLWNTSKVLLGARNDSLKYFHLEENRNWYWQFTLKPDHTQHKHIISGICCMYTWKTYCPNMHKVSHFLIYSIHVTTFWNYYFVLSKVWV